MTRRNAVLGGLILLLFGHCGNGLAADGPLARQGCPLPAPELREPLVDVRRFGATGDGHTDDTRSINDAIKSLDHGGTLIFGPGIYRHDDPIRVEGADVRLIGRGATLLAGQADRAALFLAGDRSSLYDLAVAAVEAVERGDQPETAGIVVSGTSNEVVDVRVSQSKSAGILLLGARDFLVACSDVFDTKADGIHMTQGSRRGRVVFNTVWNSEDDGIAVVSYRSEPVSSDIVIEDNTIEHIRWGRGIGVIGASNIALRRNSIRSVAMAAGIIVGREAFWNTHGVRGVDIEANVILDIQRSLSPLKPGSRTGQGGIDLNSDSSEPELRVSDVKITGNTIGGTGRDGIRINGNVTRVVILRNSLEDINRRAVEIINGEAHQEIDCKSNLGAGQSETCTP